MTAERTKGILRELGYYRGKAETLKAAIRVCELRAARAREDAIDAMAGPGAQNLSGMPGGHRIESKVETIALKLAEGTPVDDVEREQLYKAALMRRELEHCCALIQAAEGWLSGLNEQERFVIEKQYVGRMSWFNVETEYRKAYAYADRSTLRRMRDGALKRVCEMTDGIDTDLQAN